MRRSDKELTDPAAIEDILKRARICHIALCDDGKPYVVPMNYGYDGNCLYLHSAREGRKIDIIKRNNLVAFSIFIDDMPVENDIACKRTMKYRSIMGQGSITLIGHAGEKEKALQIIMSHQAGEGDYQFERARVEKVIVLRVDIEEMSGKKSGY